MSEKQPLLSFARAILDEYDQQAERWVEYGLAQANEVARVARTTRAQALGAGRAMLDAWAPLLRGDGK